MRAGFGYYAVKSARVAELVDARDLKSLGGFHRAGSIPALGTNKINYLYCIWPARKAGLYFLIDHCSHFSGSLPGANGLCTRGTSHYSHQDFTLDIRRYLY